MTKTGFAAISLGCSLLALTGCGNSEVTKADPAGLAAVASAVVDRYMPEYTAAGELVLPKNFERWVYLGSPLTPHGLNNGKANFPEFHNVYIQPWAYDEYKKTGSSRKGQSCSRSFS